MTFCPIVEQHHMVPFHDRFINSLFKEGENVQKMKERLIARAGVSNHWFNELVQELTDSSDTELLDDLQLSPNGTRSP